MAVRPPRSTSTRAPEGSGPEWLTNVGGTLYFAAQAWDTGYPGFVEAELWEYDGHTLTEIDISPSFQGSMPKELTEVGGILYFSADYGSERELWKYDGTTVTMIDINPGTGSSNPECLTDFGGTLYFGASDGTDWELWKYDGSSATEIDINPGPGSSTPYYLTDVGGTLYFWPE